MYGILSLLEEHHHSARSFNYIKAQSPNKLPNTPSGLEDFMDLIFRRRETVLSRYNPRMDEFVDTSSGLGIRIGPCSMRLGRQENKTGRVDTADRSLGDVN